MNFIQSRLTLAQKTAGAADLSAHAARNHPAAASRNLSAPASICPAVMHLGSMGLLPWDLFAFSSSSVSGTRISGHTRSTQVW